MNPRHTLLAASSLSLVLLAPPASAQQITEFAIPTPSSGVTGITVGFDGNAWFTETAANKIGRITPTGVITEFAVPTPASGPLGITSGYDGNIWFTENAAGQIGRITTGGQFLPDIPVITPVLPSLPRGIGRGAGGTVWFTAEGGPPGYRIGLIDNNSAFYVTLPAGNEDPRALTQGGDPATWFTEHGAANKIGRIAVGGALTEFPIPTPASRPNGIAYGSDTNVWFVEEIGKVGRITPSGVITEFLVPTAGSEPHSLTSGPDGRLWFTENAAGQIGAILTGGSITEYPIPTPNSRPEGIAGDGFSRLWFTETATNKIGMISLGPGPAAPAQGVPTASVRALCLLGVLLASAGFLLSRRIR